jgi:Rrf2 family transcriptional regulator, iron-sulfur cluster assembly transcription factor
MFSKACEYAFRSMIYILSKTPDGSKVGIRDIAVNTQTPEPYVAKILQALSRRGIVASIKGRNGGFFVEPKNQAISLLEIFKAIDGDTFFAKCGLGIKNCSEKRPCPIHDQYKEIRDHVKKMLGENTIQDLAQGLLCGDTFLIKK